MRVERFSMVGVTVRLAALDQYLLPEVRDLLLDGEPTLLARAAGANIWIGPLLGVRGSICYDCLAFYLGLRCEPAASPFSESAWRAAQDATARAADLHSAILLIHPGGPQEFVQFRSRADCAACGYRELPFETKVRILAHPLTGILERANGVLASRGLHIAVGPVLTPREVRADGGGRVFATGKGATPQRAVQALAIEAAERYSTLFTGLERVLLGTVERMAAFPPEEIFLFSATQYAAHQCGLVPLAPSDEILWAPARSLLDGSEVPVPAAYAWLDYIFPIENRYYLADTNGCAAGETLEDAIERALLEAVERDALAIWWYNQTPLPEAALERGELPIFEEAATVLAAEGRTLHILDITHDLGIPVTVAVSGDERGGSIYIGSAAERSAEAAAGRAIEELLQFWKWDAVTANVPHTRREWIHGGTFERFPFLLPVGRACRRDWTDGSLAERLAASGLHASYIDLTRPELDVPVVRAVVPGLRHHARRFASGRLFDVPVSLGWLAGPRSEAEMNPYACPL
jgi:oxazoline/thiazoline synthase